jgi:hypothetical protein
MLSSTLATGLFSFVGDAFLPLHLREAAIPNYRRRCAVTSMPETPQARPRRWWVRPGLRRVQVP